MLCIVVYNIFNGEFKLEPVRISYGLDLKTGLGSGPTNPNNKFVECGRKNQPDFKKEVTIMGGLEEKFRVQDIKVILSAA